MKCGPDNCPIVAFSDLTPAEQRVERKRLGAKMLAEGFTEKQVAKHFGVSQQTISSDRSSLPETGKLRLSTSKRGRKGEGRPRGKRTGPQPGRRLDMPEAASCVLDEGMSYEQAAEHCDVTLQTVRASVAREEGRREAEPLITLDMLSPSTQQKLAAAIRQHKHKLDMEFKARFNDEVSRKTREMTDRSLQYYSEKLEEYERVLNSYRGIMPRAEFRLVLACLSPDSRKSASDERLAEAFNIIKKLESLLVEKEQEARPVSNFKFPRTYEEASRMKREAMAERRAKKSNRSNAMRLG